MFVEDAKSGSSHRGGLSCCPQHMRTVCIYWRASSSTVEAHTAKLILIMCICPLQIVQLLVRDRRVVHRPHDVCVPKLQHTVPSHGAKPVVLPNPSTRTMRIYWCTSRPAVEAHVTSEISSSSDCETAGERHVHCTSPKDLYLRKGQSGSSNGERPVMVPTAYAD